MGPWDNWYHCMGNTYGTWPAGDGRGWRTRHHREHVEGDYKHPPAEGAGEEVRRRSLALMKRVPVLLSGAERGVACAALVERLQGLGAEVVDAVVTERHFHVLVRFYAPGQSPGIAIPGLCPQNALQDGRDPVPRHVRGLAKKHAAFTLRERGHVHAGGVWAVRGKIVPIEDRVHFEYVGGVYIPEHVKEGGVVWSTQRDAGGV